MSTPERDFPLHVFRFQVSFKQASGGHEAVEVCAGAFAECTGLEASMEPKLIKVGGSNYGAVQRSGPVSFATVVLKRGMTRSRDLFQWFQQLGGGAYAYRLSAEIVMLSTAGEPVITWALARCLPTKFKCADLNARGTEVGVEELHLAHEGLFLLSSGAP